MTDICRYKFLVIDDRDLLEIDNLQRKVNQAEKLAEPVLTMDAPWDTDHDQFGECLVIYDEEERGFKMWYSVVGKGTDEGGGVIADLPVGMAYATSTDGVNWERPSLGLVEVNGSKDNNYFIPPMGFYGSAIIKDPSDVPSRRYKMIFGVLGREARWAGFHVPLCLAFSADGLNWNRPTHVNPVIRGISDGCLSLYYDPDRRKYVLLTRRVPNLPRDISQYESYDLVNWEDRGRVLVAGDEHDPPEMYNVYYLAPFRYGEFHLGLINTMYTLEESESYESYNRSPHYPHDKLGHLDIQLAFTRDGKTWQRPLDRSAVVPYGAPGAPDAGAVYPAKNPVVHGGDTWIYYTARRDLHCWWHVWELEKSVPHGHLGCCMLARMPEDHWVSLDAGDNEGSFTHKPWGPPHEVFVNADAAEGEISAELVTPYGEVVPGCARTDCIPVTANGKDQALRWRDVPHPWDLHADYRGGVLARFYVRNAKLYSYTFTLPDPNGQLERDRLNARWCDHIKHRSDNWDRASNEPAGGVPPYAGPAVSS